MFITQKQAKPRVWRNTSAVSSVPVVVKLEILHYSRSIIQTSFPDSSSSATAVSVFPKGLLLLLDSLRLRWRHKSGSHPNICMRINTLLFSPNSHDWHELSLRICQISSYVMLSSLSSRMLAYSVYLRADGLKVFSVVQLLGIVHHIFPQTEQTVRETFKYSFACSSSTCCLS